MRVIFMFCIIIFQNLLFEPRIEQAKINMREKTHCASKRRLFGLECRWIEIENHIYQELANLV